MMMKNTLLAFLFILAVPALHAGRDPYVGYLYPSGVQAGSTTQILVGGQNLNGIRAALVSGNGIMIRKITPVPNFPRPDGKQHTYLLKWIKNIENGKPARPQPPEDTDSWRKNPWWEKLDQLDQLSLSLVIRDLNMRRNPLQASPSIRQMAIIEIKISPNAAPGVRELRLWGNQGISPPKLFYVDAAPHIQEPLYMPPPQQPNRKETPKPPPETPRVESFPTVLDGQILPGETDRYHLALKAGQDYTMTLTGRKLLPFIGDAVPGHFQPVLRLLDSDGAEAAFVDDEYFNPDPILRFTPSKDGEYTLEVRDNLYRGREDFVYRLLIEPINRPYQFSESSPFPKMLHTDSKIVRQPLWAETPQVITGALARKGETATFDFNARGGTQIVIDVAARRGGSPLDGVLRVFKPDGTLLAKSDDSASSLNIGEYLQQVDPYLKLDIPDNGTYRIELSDLTGAGDPNYRYWMRIGPPQPDFEVYTTQSMLNLGPGQTGDLKLRVERTDQFDEEIEISCDELELMGSAVIPAKAAEFTIKLKNPAKRWGPPLTVKFHAKAKVNGKAIRKEVIPCDEFIQAFAYTHLLPTKDFYLATGSQARKKRK